MIQPIPGGRGCTGHLQRAEASPCLPSPAPGPGGAALPAPRILDRTQRPLFLAGWALGSLPALPLEAEVPHKT